MATPSRDRGACHLVGIAGVGMNGLAQALAGNGWSVSGSDRYEDQGQDLEVIAKLKSAGIRFFPQDGSGVGTSTRAVVVSTAIEKDNADVQAAARHGVPVRHRAEMLADLARTRQVVAIAGTSGKTTVTGMVGWILEQVGADPGVVNGGVLVNWADATRIGNVRHGQSPLFVVEVDESDKSLLRFQPEWALITNQSADHYPLAETCALFEQFRGQVRQGCVLGWDPEGPWHAVRPELTRDGATFTYEKVGFEVPLLGAHNVENALHAAELCRRLGYSLESISCALRAFRGVQRRLERIGEAGGVTVLDDYAHNPAKLAAAWRAVAPYYARIHAFWRPHGFKPLSMMFDDLVETFGTLCRPQDTLTILPVYYAGGTVTHQRDSDLLVAALQARGVPAVWRPDYDSLMGDLVATARPGELVLCAGARDPGIPAFARALVRELAR